MGCSLSWGTFFNFLSLGTHPSGFLVPSSGGGGVLDCCIEAGTCEWALVAHLSMVPGAERLNCVIK